MSAVLIALLAILAISIAMYPLFAPDQRPTTAAAIDPNLESLLSAREATYSAIKDLESDHAMGKLSDADYGTLRAKYEGKALRILQELDTIQVRAASAAHAPAPNGTCPQCGRPFSAGAKFCRGCGANLTATCASCGAPVTAENKFCRRCGAPVEVLQPA